MRKEKLYKTLFFTAIVIAVLAYHGLNPLELEGATCVLTILLAKIGLD